MTHVERRRPGRDTSGIFRVTVVDDAIEVETRQSVDWRTEHLDEFWESVARPVSQPSAEETLEELRGGPWSPLEVEAMHARAVEFVALSLKSTLRPPKT